MIAREIARDLGAIVIVLSSLSLVVAGLLVFVYQVLLWLQDGVWSPHTLNEAWAWLGGPAPNMPGWKGVQKIAEIILALPLSGGLLLTAVLLMLIGELAYTRFIRWLGTH